eukprot:gene7221-328_t
MTARVEEAMAMKKTIAEAAQAHKAKWAMPMESKPMETKPMESKPMETKPMETKPMMPKPMMPMPMMSGGSRVSVTAPFTGVDVDDNGVLVDVGRRMLDDVVVDAPGTNVTADDSGVSVKAPFTDVAVDDSGVVVGVGGRRLKMM